MRQVDLQKNDKLEKRDDISNLILPIIRGKDDDANIVEAPSKIPKVLELLPSPTLTIEPTLPPPPPPLPQKGYSELTWCTDRFDKAVLKAIEREQIYRHMARLRKYIEGSLYTAAGIPDSHVYWKAPYARHFTCCVRGCPQLGKQFRRARRFWKHLRESLWHWKLVSERPITYLNELYFSTEDPVILRFDAPAEKEHGWDFPILHSGGHSGVDIAI
ncbi:uncharacterized protein CTHT_0050830 [Thermochaetoides thermophila DSM 1495]|uniref:Uncharacterized protein n=1 Tax=Chaetomium thermophilum (strain DSM 1495 / CBS 144.50 / IMI 039719) TaxID=759272 RepID=G0SD51_CHATD|nr:hypothetical protein CTHT_0050830 [Thermochaetoides thermophila DSM 1495]EGS18481.1 hypothetical protein CTHT_0050830 [Thermochaetoides thermophila DSM 1495]